MKTATEDCRKAADLILDSFNWSCTKQGHSYWREVRKNLLELATGENKQKELKAELSALRRRLDELEAKISQ